MAKYLFFNAMSQPNLFNETATENFLVSQPLLRNLRIRAVGFQMIRKSHLKMENYGHLWEY